MESVPITFTASGHLSAAKRSFKCRTGETATNVSIACTAAKGRTNERCILTSKVNEILLGTAITLIRAGCTKKNHQRILCGDNVRHK